MIPWVPSRAWRPATPQLQDYLTESALRRPEKVALVCGLQHLTYAELERRSNQAANALARLGVSRGDRVVVFADNSPEAVVAFWGGLKANAVVSMISPQTKSEKLAHLLDDCGAAALVTQGRHVPVAARAVAATGRLRPVLVADARGAAGATGAGAAQGVPLAGWNDALAAESEADAPPRRNLDVDLAAIIYTSGSTGDPKGIMLTHRNMLAAATSITSYLENTEDDVILNALPLSFDYGLYQMIMAFRMTARLVLERSFAYPVEILAAVVREQVTGFPGVPTVFAMMAAITLDRYDLSRVRYVTNTAAALSVKQIAFIRRAFPNARLFSMYGLTECKRCSYLPPEDIARKPTSVGIAIPNTELWIVDEHDRQVGPNEVGQLVVRGATVMKGYWGKPEDTARRLRPGPLPGEQVLYTGDLCRLDEEGYLYFVGRMDEVIKSRGEKVAPEEVERALAEIAGVREAAVAGVPDEVLGEAVWAYVVPEDRAVLDEQAVRRECQARLELVMVPQHVVFVTQLPRTPGGKIDRARLGQR
jgi:amino acid adenylation domain-containing protein